MGCRYASSAVQLMDHDLFVLSLSLAFPLVSPTAVLFCGHIGLGLPGAIPPYPRRLEKGTVLRPRELHAARGWLKCTLTRFRPSEMLMMASISSCLCEAQ